MKYILLLLFYISFNLNAQTIDEKWVKENYIKKEYSITMRDGVKLFTAVYTPKSATEKHPFLMVRTPYSCAPYGEGNFQNRLYTAHWKEYLKEGYIFVFQDVRGRWMSEGEFVDVRPFNPNKKKKTDIDEASDTYDAVDWLVKNIPNNNGNLGVFGISYPGFYSTMAALSGHPAVKAVSPQAPVTDWFMGDDFHHNGAFMLNDAFNFYSSFGQPRPKPTTIGPKEFKYYTEEKYQFYLETGALKNFSKLMGDSIKFWTDLMNHPNLDDWWKARDARVGFTNYTKQLPAIMVVGGLFDAEDCYGAWRLFDAIKNYKNTYLVMGPWYHGGWLKSDGSYLGNVAFGFKTSMYYQQNLEIPFFNYYLKGKGDIATLGKTNVFYSGENLFHSNTTWPPIENKNKELYLLPGGKLNFEPKYDNHTDFTQYTSDPNKPVPYIEGPMTSRTREYMTDDQRFASKRTDVVCFETDYLKNDLTIAGTVTANISVALSSTDADFIVKIIDVYPNDFSYKNYDDSIINSMWKGKNYVMNGYQMLVRGEVMRGKYRNSFEKPEPFEPNKITTVKLCLPDIAHTFKKGHKLMIQIQSTWFPLVDRNPQQFIDIYHCEDKDFIKSDIKIYHNLDNKSYLTLPDATPKGLIRY